MTTKVKAKTHLATNKQTRHLLKKAAELGWEADDELDGRGHIVLRHENGEAFRLASTPSDWRSEKNALASLERLSGNKLERHARRRGRNPQKMAGYTQTVLTESAASWSRRIEMLLAEHRDLILELKILSMGEPSRTEINRAVEVIKRVSEIETFLTELRQPLPDLNLKDVGR